MKSARVHPGQPGPNFSLPAIDGVVHRLSDFQGRKVVLVFYRGHWCTACQSHLAELRGSALSFTDHGATVIAVSSESVASAAAGVARDQLPFLVLSDESLTAIDQYGVRHEDEPEGRAIARPSVFLLDRSSVVRFAFVGETAFQRPNVLLLLLALESLP